MCVHKYAYIFAHNWVGVLERSQESVCMCVCIHTHIHTCQRERTRVCVCVFVYTHTYTHTQTDKSTYAVIAKNQNVCMCVCVCIYTHRSIQVGLYFSLTLINEFLLYAYTHSYRPGEIRFNSKENKSKCVDVCVCVCIYRHIWTYWSTLLFQPGFDHWISSVCIHTHTWTHTHTHIDLSKYASISA